MPGCWGLKHVTRPRSKQGGEGLGKTMGGECLTTGKAKEQLFPYVTPCFMVPMVVPSAGRDGWPWGALFALQPPQMRA